MPEPPWFIRVLKINSEGTIKIPKRITLIEIKCQYPNLDNRRILIVISLYLQKTIFNDQTVIGPFFDIMSMFGIFPINRGG